MKEELIGIDRYLNNKERLLTQASSNLEAMENTRQGLQCELHQVILINPCIYIYVMNNVNQI